MLIFRTCAFAAITICLCTSMGVAAQVSSFRTLDAWDILDYKGAAKISLTQDSTTPPGYGPEVVAIKGDAVIGLLKGFRLEKGEIQVLYREMQPQEMDADGLLLFHGQFGASVAEEHNAKIERAHCWMENDNDSGLHFTRLNANGRETNLLQTAGVGLVNGEWNRTGWIWQKVRVDGAKVQGKYWPAHEAEPADWQLEIDDAGLSEGRVGFRIGSGDVHIAYFAAGETLPLAAPPMAYLFPEEERLTRTDNIPLTLFTNAAKTEERSFTLRLEKDTVEILRENFTLSCAPGSQTSGLRLTTTNAEFSGIPIPLPGTLSAGRYVVRLLHENQTVSETAFEILDVAALRKRFDAVERNAGKLGTALAGLSSIDKRMPRLRVISEAALAHHQFGLTQLDSGDIEAAERSLYFALEALDELRGYKGQWLQDLAPDLTLELSPMPTPPRYPHSEDPMIMVYSPKYLIRFGVSQYEPQSWVMGQDYTVTIPWEVEGASPDRDFTITVEVCDPLKRRVVARSTKAFEIPTSRWKAGETYLHTIPLSVLAEDAKERPAVPNIADGWHIITVSVRDAKSNAPLLLDNKPVGWHGRPEAAFEAGRVYISSTPVEIQAWFKKGSGTFAGTARRVLRTKVPDPFLNHAEIQLASAPESAVGQARTERLWLRNLGKSEQEGQLVFSVYAETGRLLQRSVNNITIAPAAQELSSITWTPRYCGALKAKAEFIQKNATKTLTEETLCIAAPDSLHFHQVVRLDSRKLPHGAVQTLLHLKADKPAAEMMTVRVYADQTLLTEKTTRLNELNLPVRPHFGYYDVEIQVGDVTCAQRIIATSVLARNAKLLVNGEPFIVKGVNVHGMDSQSPARTRLQMELMKDLGFNSWRGDYPSRWQTDMAYDLNTTYSALAPFSCIGTDELFPRIDGPKLTACRELSRLFLERYVDSAGVILWNSCNEIGGETTNFIISLRPVYQQLDPARRPVHYANLYGQDRWQGQDVMAVNYYFGRGERAVDRHPIIQTSLEQGLRRGIPVIYTEYNSFYGSIHTTGAEAVRDLFGWGVKQGMSGGYLYMRFTDSSHPSVFDAGLNTHKVLDEALQETFADVAFQLIDDGQGSTALQITNKRDATLRKLRLNLVANGIPQPQRLLADLKSRAILQSLIPQEKDLQSLELSGTLSFESHHGIASTVEFRLIK
jgi:glycosyl hydrolase family 2